MTESTVQQDCSLFRTHRSALADLPPSAKLVARVLDEQAGLSQGQIAEETLLPGRTVRYALNRLEDVDLVETRYDFSDGRRRRYVLTPPE